MPACAALQQEAVAPGVAATVFILELRVNYPEELIPGPELFQAPARENCQAHLTAAQSS